MFAGVLSCTTTGGNAPDGSTCTFPFTYADGTFTDCTAADNAGIPWCYIGAGAPGDLWGNCNCAGDCSAPANVLRHHETSPIGLQL